MEEEQWVEHPIYTNYIISSIGSVYSCKRNKILKGINENNLTRYHLHHNGEIKNISLYNLVLDTFGPNDFNAKNVFEFDLPDQSEEMVEVEIDNKKTLVPVWKKIVDFPFYRISYTGEVFSCASKAIRSEPVWRKLNLSTNSTGYKQTSFFKDKKEYKVYVHKLVLEAYVSKRPENLVCCHKDGNKLNNCVSNLRWDTPKANTQDRLKHNTMLFGENHPRSVLTEKLVLEIHDLKSKGFTSKKIGELLNINHRTVYTVVQGGNWKWLHPVLKDNFKNGKFTNNKT